MLAFFRDRWETRRRMTDEAPAWQTPQRCSTIWHPRDDDLNFDRKDDG